MPRPIRIPLHALPAFRAAATLQNLRAAAQALHLTHSAVSQQIRGLEEQLGFDLFERRGRRIVLNAAGEALLRSVEPALALLDDGAQAAGAAHEVLPLSQIAPHLIERLHATAGGTLHRL